MLAPVLDIALDRTIVAGWSRLGFLLRSRSWTGDRADPAPGALRGRVAVVTGASAGLGLATATGLARLGATVHLVVRDEQRGERARAAVAAAVPGAGLHVTRCDLSSLADVARAAPAIAAARPHALVHNAGVLPPRRTMTAEGHELAMATHVLGPFLLTALVAGAMPPGGRVLFVSSGGMYAQRLTLDDVGSEQDPYRGTATYARTKRMQVVLAGLWAQRLRDAGVSVHSLHPGWADTPGLAGSLPRFDRLISGLLRTPQEGADTAVWLAAAPAAAIGSGLFWQDRRPRREHYVPWTRETPTDRARLWSLCEHLTGASAP